MPASPSSATLLPDDADADGVVWFSASRRLVVGRPDARYGWLCIDGQPCIVKALDLSLGERSRQALRHERQVLDLLHAAGAPVPRQRDGAQPHWVVTEFAGLSLHALSGGDGRAALLSPIEQLTAWAHLLRRCQPLAARGVLPVDLWAGNIVLPLAAGVRGQLMLTEPVLIDHAHTMVAGLDLQQPLWIHPRMERLAPEVRRLLEQDQQAGDPAARIAPRSLQRALDGGLLDVEAAVQYAVGHEIARSLPAADGTAPDGALGVAARMTRPRPEERFGGIAAAAQALLNSLPCRPRVSACRIREVGPQAMVDGPCIEPLPAPPPDTAALRPAQAPGPATDDEATRLSPAPEAAADAQRRHWQPALLLGAYLLVALLAGWWAV